MKKLNRQCMHCGETKRTEIRKPDFICATCMKNIGIILMSKNVKLDRFMRDNKALINLNQTLIDILYEFKKCPICKIKNWLFNRRYRRFGSHNNC